MKQHVLDAEHILDTLFARSASKHEHRIASSSLGFVGDIQSFDYTSIQTGRTAGLGYHGNRGGHNEGLKANTCIESKVHC
jgi:hypothetical protein